MTPPDSYYEYTGELQDEIASLEHEIASLEQKNAALRDQTGYLATLVLRLSAKYGLEWSEPIMTMLSEAAKIDAKEFLST